MSYKFSRTDSNQAEIVKEFRKLGWSVAHTHQIGKGFPDICVSKSVNDLGMNILVEIKDGSLPPSARKLTKDEIKFHSEWQGPLYVVENLADVIAIDKIFSLTLEKI